MNKILSFLTKSADVSKLRMTDQANQRCSEVAYQKDDMVFLSSKNISTDRPSKKLDDKMLSPFQISKKVRSSYRLDLPSRIKIHDVFYPSLPQKVAVNPLPSQWSDPLMPVIMDEKEEWEINNILDARYFGKSRRL